MTTSAIRVRFAPSPTGPFHVGGARTALFNYLFAKANQGKFVLRIEDTDRDRSQKKYVQEILASLKWLGINWDEGPEVGGEYGPYLQSERNSFYEKYLNQLKAAGKIYPCFSTEEELLEKKKQAEAKSIPYVYDRTWYGASEEEVQKRIQNNEKFVYRFVNPDIPITLEDQVKGRVEINSKTLGDFIISKSNGDVTYNFVNVVDDLTMKISHVIRGDDHLTNTFKQILIFQALKEKPPTFAHLPLILGDNHEKLSKRHGASSVLEFREKGYYSDPLVNHLALLGWSPLDKEEVIPREKLEKSFTALNFSKAPAVFDYNRLNYLNGLYLRNLPQEKILEDLKAVLVSHNCDLTHPKLEDILLHLKDHCKTTNDILVHYNNFFSNEIAITEENKKWIDSEKSKELFQLAFNLWKESEEMFIQEAEFKNLINLAKDNTIKGKDFFMPLRIKLTGSPTGIELDKFIFFNYRKTILKRLQ